MNQLPRNSVALARFWEGKGGDERKGERAGKARSVKRERKLITPLDVRGVSERRRQRWYMKVTAAASCADTADRDRRRVRANATKGRYYGMGPAASSLPPSPRIRHSAAGIHQMIETSSLRNWLAASLARPLAPLTNDGGEHRLSVRLLARSLARY